MNVLVTGGAGYIGSHTAKALYMAGHIPIVLDNLVRGHREHVRWGPFVQADLADRVSLEAVFDQYSIDAVLHFAAFAYVDESMREPARYFGNNVSNTLSLLEVMRCRGVQTIVFSSSCATYGNPQKLPISEDHPQCPVNPYGCSKLMIEEVLRWYGSIYGLSWVTLRYFNAAGADPEGDLGEQHDPETHLIPLVIAAASGQIAHVDIFGGDFDTEDGTAVRDYIHVADLAQAHAEAMAYLQSGGPSTAFNLGTGMGCSVAQVVAAVERISGRRVPFRMQSRRPGDPACLVANVAKARRLLRFQTSHSSLEEVVRTAWRWHHKSRTELTLADELPSLSTLTSRRAVSQSDQSTTTALT